MDHDTDEDTKARRNATRHTDHSASTSPAPAPPAPISDAASDAADALTPSTPVTKDEYETIAAFRYAIRRFLHFSEQAARHEGLTPQQHQLLLAVKGFPGRDCASVSELAQRLQMLQHSVVGLIDRTEALGLVRREHGATDRRQVFIYLTADGEEKLRRLTTQHRRELRTVREALFNVL